MILVCEPQCKGISHENVNSGFIYGLLFAYPKEKVVFFADKSHFKEVKNILKSKKVNIHRLRLIPIKFNSRRSFSLSGIINYYLLFNKIFNKTFVYKSKKVFFLSTNPIILLLSPRYSRGLEIFLRISSSILEVTSSFFNDLLHAMNGMVSNRSVNHF